MTIQFQLPSPKFKSFLPGTGNPNVGGFVYTLIPGGSINQTKTSYTDATGVTVNANPVVLDANGEANIWGTGLYKIIVQNSAGVQIYSIDNVDTIAYSTSSGTSGQWISSGLTP